MSTDNRSSYDDSPAWRAARETGLDMDLLEESLLLSPEERLRLHAIALNRVEVLERAMKGSKGHEVPSDRLIDRLLQENIECVIIGGVAAVLHGSSYVTRDLDICVRPQAASFLAIQKALG